MLKPRGLLLLQGDTPNRLEYRTGGPSAVENHYSDALLRTAVADWEIIVMREHEAVIEEGSGHSGRSVLIDLVARETATGR